jgi:hypothetical protein
MRIHKNVFGAVGVAAIAAGLAIPALSEAATSRICPAAGGGPAQVIANLNAGSADCWTGPDWPNGTTWSRGQVTTTSGSGRSVGAYAFYGLEHNEPGGGWDGRALSSGYNSSNVLTCYVLDYTGNGAWEYNTSSACNNTSYVRVEAYMTVLH